MSWALIWRASSIRLAQGTCRLSGKHLSQGEVHDKLEPLDLNLGTAESYIPESKL